MPPCGSSPDPLGGHFLSGIIAFHFSVSLSVSLTKIQLNHPNPPLRFSFRTPRRYTQLRMLHPETAAVFILTFQTHDDLISVGIVIVRKVFRPAAVFAAFLPCPAFRRFKSIVFTDSTVSQKCVESGLFRQKDEFFGSCFHASRHSAYIFSCSASKIILHIHLFFCSFWYSDSEK